MEKVKTEKAYCPHCGKEISIGVLMGSKTSEKKAASSAANGKKGGRPPAVIKKANIAVENHYKANTAVGKANRQVKDPAGGKHLTGWTLSYTFDDGRAVERFYQSIGLSLKDAKHQFFKTMVEPNQNG